MRGAAPWGMQMMGIANMLSTACPRVIPTWYLLIGDTLGILETSEALLLKFQKPLHPGGFCFSCTISCPHQDLSWNSLAN